MSPSARQIEREVEASRANLEETVEALKGKMSLGQMVDEAAGYFKDSGGGEIVANLGRQMRDNPLPLALVGLGLAWLMSGRGHPHISSHRHDAYGTGYDPDFGFKRPRLSPHGPDGPRIMRSVDPRRLFGTFGRRRADLVGGGEDGRRCSSASETRPRCGRRGGERHSQRRRHGGERRRCGCRRGGKCRLRHRIGGHRASGTAPIRPAARPGTGGRTAYRGARRAYRGASHLGSGVYGGASRVGGSVRRSFSDVLENEPLVLGALGLAVGAAIGALLPRTQAEDRYLGETSDHLRETAEDFGKEKLEQGKAVAEEVYRTAKEKAEETGLTASGEDSLVGKVGEVARATMEKARESAAEAGARRGRPERLQPASTADDLRSLKLPERACRARPFHVGRLRRRRRVTPPLVRARRGAHH